MVWFRVDLRVSDNTALATAVSMAGGPGGRGVVGLFVVDPADWRRHDWAGVKVGFVLRSVRALSDELARLNIPLLVRVAQTIGEVPAVVTGAAREAACDVVVYGREHEVHETQRDERVGLALRAVGVKARAVHDLCVLAPGEVLTQSETPYTVYTPFKKQWIAEVTKRGGVTVLPTPAPQAATGIASEAVPTAAEVGFESVVPEERWPAGEREAQRRLAVFCERAIDGYKDRRDYPAEPGTSVMSPHLASGTVSARQCVVAAVEANGGKLVSDRAGPTHWISEVVWREFYKHILFHYPRVCKGRAFKVATEAIVWSDNQGHFEAWKAGRTGVPIVDAAMRALVAEGWMHNRLRMIVAMYLTKDLFIDWRLGERWFMQNLVDGDLSQNNGGWQWSASTGTDAAPYFRIFNPVMQSERFDPQGDFIRRWVPELAGLDARDIHDPSALPGLLRGKLDYPEPIVDRASVKDRVMAAFKEVGSA
jgi:deoxyribodipyrimidine photo-lyase